MLIRTALLATLASALALPAAQAGTRHTDPQGRFSVDVPAEWEAAQPESQKIALIMGRKAGNDLLGVCIVVVTETPQTNGREQTEISDAMTAMLTRDFWTATYKAQGAQDIAVGMIGTRDAAGRKVHYVHSEFTTKNQDGTTQRMKAQEEIHAVPGRTHDIGCITRKEKFELARADFDAIQKSYTPQSGLIAQAPATPSDRSMLTLFANAGFGGTARVVTGETPNITYVSWPQQSGSVIVHGFGEWQACEGPNFTGVCMTLSGPVSAATNEALRIGSVRPLASPDPLRGLSNAIATDSMAMLSEALKKLRSTAR
jgi:hypothetical protein